MAKTPFLSVLTLLTVLTFTVTCAAQGVPIEIDLDDSGIQVSPPAPSGGVPISEIGTDLQITIPDGAGGIQLDPACDAVTVTVPKTEAGPVVTRGGHLTISVNGKNFPLAANTDSVMYWLQLPGGGTLTLNPRNKSLSIRGPNAALLRRLPLHRNNGNPD
jgi:hypothetical protein